MFTLLHRRNDGTFVILHNNLPYHVTEDNPLFDEVAEAAFGVELPPEPAPPPVPLRPSPTKADLMLRLEQIAKQIADMDAEAP